jgi:hypothetical protein
MSHRKALTRQICRMAFGGAASITLVCVVVAVSRPKWNSPTESHSRVVEDTPIDASARTRIEGELIALRPTGFHPREIRRPAGRPFLLAVENQSSVPVISLSITRGTELPLRDISIARERHMWSDIVELPRGTYILREAAHPDWICNITIE